MNIVVGLGEEHTSLPSYSKGYVAKNLSPTGQLQGLFKKKKSRQLPAEGVS